jgi:hypothetical protein
MIICVDKASEYKTTTQKRLRIVWWTSFISTLVLTSIVFGALFHLIYRPYNVVLHENNAKSALLKKQLVSINRQLAITKPKYQKILNLIENWEFAYATTKAHSSEGDTFCNEVCWTGEEDMIPCSVALRNCDSWIDPDGICKKLLTHWCQLYIAANATQILQIYSDLENQQKDCNRSIKAYNNAFKNGFPGERFQPKWLGCFFGIFAAIVIIFITINIVGCRKTHHLYYIKPKLLDCYSGDHVISELTCIMTRVECIHINERTKVSSISNSMIFLQDSIDKAWKKRIAFLGGYLRPESPLYKFLNEPATKDIKRIIMDMANLGPNRQFKN